MEISDKLNSLEGLLAEGRVDDVVRICQEVLADDPGNAQALITLGQVARAAGDRAAALVHYRAVAERLPEDIWRKLDVVEELLALGHFPEAQAVCREILSIDPDNPQAVIALGQIARAMGDRAAALVHYQAVAERLPEDIWRKLDVVDELRALGRFQEAEEVYREILAIDSGNPQALIALGQAARAAGDRAAALVHYQAVAERLPEDIWRKLDVVEELLALGQFPEAVPLSREILAIDPDNLQALTALAQSARAIGDRGTSLIHSQALAERSAGDIQIRFDIVGDLVSMDRFAEAEAACREILAIDPGNSQALIILSKAARRAGDRGSALAYLRAASAGLPEDIYLRLIIIGDLLTTGRGDEATLIYQELIGRESDVDQALSGEEGRTAAIDRVEQVL